jgi:NAD dependent epimerase/dehydratase family enzyme
MRLARAGLGGRQGTGNQYVSWIHERDFARAIDWFITHDLAQGVYNVTAPGATRNRTFMRQLRERLGKSFGMHIPAWLLRIGAFFIRTEPELILKSRKVYPQRLLNEGFVFEFSDSTKAFGDLCRM